MKRGNNEGGVGVDRVESGFIYSPPMLAIFTMRPRSFLISGKNTFVTSIKPHRFTSATSL